MPKRKKPVSKKPKKPRKRAFKPGFGYSQRFPPIERERHFPNFDLTLYRDGSRLYFFKDRSSLFLTPRGVQIYKANPQLIKDYRAGKKLYITSGANSDIFTIVAGEKPLAVKEHQRGITALTQLQHMRAIRRKLWDERSIHEVPEYYAAYSASGGAKPEGVSIMDLHANAHKVEREKERLSELKTRESKELLQQLIREYEQFKRFIERRNILMTDFHEGNILTYYNPARKKFVFVILDQ